VIPSRFWPWVQVGVAFLIQATGAGALSYSYSVIAVPLAETFEPSRMVLMLGLTCMTLGAGFVSPMAGIAIDRLSLKLIMVAAILMTALGYVGLSLAAAMWQVPLIYGVLLSFGYVLLGPLCASTLLTRWFHENRGMALGIAAAGTSFGGFLYPPLIQALTELVGWREGLRWVALCIAATALPVWLLAVDHPTRKGFEPTADGGAQAPDASGRFSSTYAIIRHRSFWMIALVVTLMFGCFTATMGNIVPFALDVGATREQGAMMISNIALSAIAGTLFFGWLSDRFDVRLALAGLISIMALALTCFWGTPDFPRLALGSLVLGLGSGGMLPVWSALLGQVYGALNYGRVMGLMSPILLPFNLLTPPLTGWIRDVTGAYHWAFVAFVALLCLAVLMIPLIERSDGNRAVPAAAG